MKCKLHPYHTGAGVCGACLHDRLLPLVSSDKYSPNNKPDSSSSPPPLSSSSSQPAPILFPRSVSPYVPASFRETKLHFFHTPQAGPATTCSKKKGKFSFVYSFFGRARKDKARSSSSSSGWMHRFMRRGRRRKCHVDDVEPTRRCSARVAMPGQGGNNLAWKVSSGHR